ncbi:MAG: 16S rRNA (cytidine(1402)-2'-O)-methyltransferase [Chloroflexi bacterium]|nr:16S rRNA (cytidine(1402)-2'-O)-methyltransferase [Chloroflexota bacterium]MCL5075163.1 16S rRNA (cytidine(1402)-2'-O)-methyltransferase [Chloroflexota bacterium]
MGILYLVGTPIGNLEDISLRALRILREVSLVAAEDTRQTKKLFARYHISTPLISYHEHNKRSRLPYLCTRLEEKDIALVSEAGMPGISDPGYELVCAAIERGFAVVPIPGASALLAALAASGLPTDQFAYVGYLPRRQSDRRRLLTTLREEPRTIVAFESPHRLLRSLQDALEVLGERPIAVARELTKVHEEIWRGSIEQAIAYFTEKPPLGEFTLVIAGVERRRPPVDRETIKEQLLALMDEGMSGKEAVSQIAAATGVSKREIYKILTEVSASLDEDRLDRP